MAFNMPFNFDQAAFFHDNISNSDEQYVDDHPVNMDRSWMNIDPSLVNLSYQNGNQAQTPRTFQVQQQIQQQQSQHPTMQRFVNEPELALFTADPLPNPPRNMNQGLFHPSIPISSLPQASHQRMASLSPSQGLASSCGSAHSPQTEPEYFQDSRHYKLDNYYGQNLPDLEGPTAHYQSYSLPQPSGYSCVSMNQVQTFADPEEVMFDTDESFGEIAIKSEYAVDFEHHSQSHHSNMKPSGDSHPYRYVSDKGLGALVRDEASPENSTINVDDSGPMSDIDAEGDVDIDIDIDVDHVPDSPISDLEYTPKSSRTRKRRPSPPSKVPFLPPPRKRSRISKPLSKSKDLASCKSCNHAPFKDIASLQRHVASAHTRAFICVFDFAGCASTFANKNEWKRHVSSQHLNLTAWVCELGGCGKIGGHNHSRTPSSSSSSTTNPSFNGNGNGSGGGAVRGSEFNRKDLFTQHLRRMHVPAHVKRKKTGTDAAWEEQIRALQSSCLIIKRQAPRKLRCPVTECGMPFEGQGCWDERMEHVGKHLEAKAQGKGRGEIRQGEDELLVGWALKEGIVETTADGVVRLVLGGAVNAAAGSLAKHEDDEDAEGEEE